MEEVVGKEQTNVKKRETNMELLRIVAMLMVIALHCVGRGKLLGNEELSIGNLLFVRILDSSALIANSLFLMTTGYYMINKNFNLKRILNLWGKTILYCFIIWGICVLLGRKTHYLRSLFPVTIGNYWFISAYISLYFLMPIINIGLNKLSQKQFKYLLIVLIVMFSVIRVISNPSAIYSGAMFPVILMYSIGAYIRKYVEAKKDGKYIIKYILLTIVFVLIYIILTVMKSTTTNVEVYSRLYIILTAFREFSCIIPVAMAICVFMKFKTINIKSVFANKLITFVAPSMFSIYIIHDNINICDELWQNMKFANYAQSWLMIPYVFCVIIAVFLVCLIIDLIRRGIYAGLKKIPIVNKGVKKLNEKINILNTKINNIFEVQ